MKRALFFLVILVFASGMSRSQSFEYKFSKDSLDGFDQRKLDQLISGFSYSEGAQKEISYVHKRNFINKKYGLGNKGTIEKSVLPQSKANMISSACDDEDFELALAAPVTASNQIQGWTCYNGSNYILGPVNCSISNVSYTNTIASSVINGTNYIDPAIGAQYPLFSVFGVGSNGGSAVNPSLGTMFGNSFMRVGNQVNDYSSDQVSKRMKVTANNSLFRYAYIFVSNSTGHPCCDAALFRVNIKNITTNSVLTAFDNLVSVPFGSASCTPSPNTLFYVGGSNTVYNGSNGSLIYNKWKIENVDLSNYIGDSVSVDFLTVDCTAGGHYGYAYIDAECSNSRIYLNGNIATSSAYTICNTATLSGAPNLNYLWNGPSSSSITNVTTQSVIANVSGIYTLNLMSGTITLNVQTISLTVNNSSPIVVTANNYTTCIGGVSMLNVSGPSLVSYTWSQGSTVASPFVSSTLTTMYSVTVTNIYGCTSVGFVGINVFDCTDLELKQAVKTNFNIYPNPNSGSFILTSTNDEKVVIYDNLGRKVQEVEFNQTNDHKFIVQNYKPGVYLVKGSGLTRKIIVLD